MTEETLNSLSPDLQSQELMSPGAFESVNFLWKLEGFGLWKDNLQDDFVLIKFQLTAVKKEAQLSYTYREIEVWKKQLREIFSNGFNWASTYKRVRTEFWASFLKQLSTLPFFPSKP